MTLDLKNLRLLVTLFHTQSLTQAALACGLSQSSASYGLEKLRQAFNDPLFIRTNTGMLPTEQGRYYALESLKIVEHFDSLINQNSFDPATKPYNFKVAGTAYEIDFFIGPLYRKLYSRYPHISLEVSRYSQQDMVHMLETQWDVLLLASPIDSAHLKMAHLAKDNYITFYDPNYQTPPTSLVDFSRKPHAIVQFSDQKTNIIDRALKKNNLKRTISLRVDSFESLASIMKGTDLITTLPSRFNQTIFKDYAYTDCPLQLDPLNLSMVWHEVKDKTPAHQWLRGQIKNNAHILRAAL